MRDNPAMCQTRFVAILIRGMVCAGRCDVRRLGARERRCGDAAMTNLSQDTAVMLDTMVARFNLENYQKRLKEEADETKRQTLIQLIAEEKAKLSALLPTKL
jgi:hypothetical protein